MKYIAIRSLKKHKSRAALTILCVFIGVSVFASANIGADGVQRAYVNQLLSTFGDVDIQIRNSSNGFLSYNETLLDLIKNVEGVVAVSPRISGFYAFQVNETNAEYMYMIAFDPKYDNDFGQITPESALDLMVENNCLINQIAADEFNLSKNKQVNWLIGYPTVIANVSLNIAETVVISGKLALEKNTPIIAMDLAKAEEILGLSNEASELVVKTTDPLQIEVIISRLETVLGEDYDLYSQKLEVLEDAARNISFIRGALNVFAGISLAVTAVLIVNVMLMNLNERKRDLGILRAIGASKSQIFRLVLFETFLYGLTGSITGAVAGILLSTFMLQLLGAAIQSIASLSDTYLVLDPLTLVSSILVGVIIVTLAGVYPAKSASKVNILEVLRPRMKGIPKRKVNIKLVISGVSLVCLSVVLMYLIGPFIILLPYFTAIQLAITVMLTGGLILSFSGGIHYVVKGVTTLITPLIKGGKQIIERNISRNRKRTSLMFTMITIGLVFVIFFSSLSGTLIATFSSVIRVFTGSDIRVNISDGANFNYTYTLESISGVSKACPSIEVPTTLSNYSDYKVGVIFINTSSFPQTIAELSIIEGPPVIDAFNQLSQDNRTVIISNDLAENLSLSIGDYIWIDLAQPTRFKIIATTNSFYGYPQYMFKMSQVGRVYGIYASLEAYEDIYNTTQAKTFFVKVDESADPLEVASKINDVVSSDFDSVSIISAKEQEILISETIQQFLNIVYFFISFALIVAAIGIATTMIIAVSERKREIGILKALGMSNGQIMKMIIGESVVIAIIGFTVGVLGGLLLWYLFLSQVMWRSPGIFFTLEFVIPVDIIIILGVICITLAIVASVYPAYKAMKLEVIEALRKD
ncbi:MAG: FtsX-like permease family protein [Candidatus Odinarchaeia archaeon]